MSPDAAAAHGHGHAAHRTKSSSSAAAVAEHGWFPQGHVGHLTPEEEEAFASFKALVEEKGLYKPGPPPSHDDATLLRFLRARRWSVEDGYKQFKDTEDWRAATDINVLYDTIDVEAYDQGRRLYPQWTGRRDKRGIPVYLFEIRHLDAKTIHNYEKTTSNTYSKAKPDGSTPPKLLRLFALYENLTRFVQPLCSEMTDRDHARVPITLSTNIVDVSGVSLRQFWNLKNHMQAASQLATAHYPETLDRIFIIGAPMFFSTVWSWIKRWFDPVTVSKIFILSHSEVKPVLNSFIEAANIPKQYGGDLDFEWGGMPNLDPAIRELVAWENGYEDFPVGPVYWRPIDGGKRLECVAFGSVEQKERVVRVGTIPVAFADEKVDGHAVHKFASAPAPEGEAADADADGRLVEAHGDVPEGPTPTGADAPVAVDGVKAAELPAELPAESAAPGAGEPQEALVAETQGVQNLSIADEKAGAEKAAGNGQAVPA